MWTADRYYSLLMWMTLGMGAAFEFPLLVVLAVYMGLIEVATLRKYRRHAVVVIFIIAAVVTPTPDPLNQTLFAVPLIILYELSIWVSAALGKRRDQVHKGRAYRAKRQLVILRMSRGSSGGCKLCRGRNGSSGGFALPI